MNRELTPDSVSEVIPFNVATCERFEHNLTGNAPHCTNGGISSDGTWAWLVNGSSIEIVSTNSGERLGAWTFGIIVKNSHCTISCTCELKDRKSPKILIGLDCSDEIVLFVFDIRRSKIIRAIEVPAKITVLEIVSTEGGANPANHALQNDLRFMFGIVAVGMENGCLLLIDLLLDEPWSSDETNVWNLLYLKRHLKRPDEERRDAIYSKKHFCLALPSAYSGEIAVKSHDNSCITALKYLAQLTCISVGYENGCVEFWNLNKVALESVIFKATSSSLELPVVEIAFQEPENDPSQFCYLWVARGNQVTGELEDNLASLTLYALKFSQKCWMQDIGNHYEELNDCDMRFEYFFGCSPHQVPDYSMQGSRVLRCYTLKDSVIAQNCIEDNSCDDGLDVSEYSLLVVIWEAWFRDSPTKLHAFIGIFDLNQWYHSQMPHELKVLGNNLSPYFGFFSLEEILELSSPDFILDIQIIPGSIAHLRSITPNEHHFYPSALAFRACCLIDTGFIHTSYLGLQRQILAKFRKHGALALMDPNEIYNMCIYSGLIKTSEEGSISVSLGKQREALLDVALENGLLDFMNSCVAQAGIRDMFISSYSPKSVVEWAWKKTGQIKSALDRISLPLFNCSGELLERNQIRQMHMYSIQLQMLASIFQLLINHSIMNTEQGLREVEMKMNVVNLIILYHRVVLWFYESGLLPEHEEDQNYGPDEVSYPVNRLQQVYLHRRQEVQSLNEMIRDTNLLLIDNVISRSGTALASLWEKDGGKSTYPPPSIYSLLNMFLIDDVNISIKHHIAQYFLFDISVCFADDKHDHLLSQLTKFPTVINMSASMSQLTRAFWLLDHKEFEAALDCLLDPMISSTDMEPWQNTLIIKSFLYQGHCKKALKYCSIRRPAVRSPEDMKLHLTVLLANELITEAFQFQRDFRDHETAGDILHHFFLGCQQTKSLAKLLSLPLNTTEEDAFIQFLQNSSDCQTQEILLMYFIQRSRFVQARALNSSLTNILVNDQDTIAREKLAIRNMIVNGYTSVLPRVQLKLASYMDSCYWYHSNANVQAKPNPLSAFVRPGAVSVSSQATLIKTVMEKVEETWYSSTGAEATPFRHGIYQKSSCNTKLAENVPFICAPAAIRNKTEHDISALVFPLTANKKDDYSDQEYTTPPIKRSRIMDISSTKRVSCKYSNLEVMSMLQMPPVHRKTPLVRPVSKVTAQDRLPCLSPQSILKSCWASSCSIHSDSDSGMLVKKIEMNKVKDADQSNLAKQLRFDVSDSESSESRLITSEHNSKKKSHSLAYLEEFHQRMESEAQSLDYQKEMPSFKPASHGACGTSSVMKNKYSYMFREPDSFQDNAQKTSKEIELLNIIDVKDRAKLDNVVNADASDSMYVDEASSDMHDGSFSPGESQYVTEALQTGDEMDAESAVMESSPRIIMDTDKSDIESLQSFKSGINLSPTEEDFQASFSSAIVSTSCSSISSSPASKTSSAKTSPSNKLSSPVTRSQSKSLYETVQSYSSTDTAIGNQTESKAKLRRSARQLSYKEVEHLVVDDTLKASSILKPDSINTKPPTKHNIHSDSGINATTRTNKETPRLKNITKRTAKIQKSSTAASELLLMVPSAHTYNTRSSVSGESVSSMSPTSSICSTASTKKKDGKESKTPSRLLRSAKTLSDDGTCLPETEPECKFIFSSPEIPNEQLAAGDSDLGIVAKPFIFSPPLTRSRTQKNRKPSEPVDVSSNQDLSKPVVIKKSKQKILMSPRALQSNSPINFISPPVVISEHKKGTAQKKSSSSKAVKFLRSRSQAPLRSKKLS